MQKEQEKRDKDKVREQEKAEKELLGKAKKARLDQVPPIDNHNYFRLPPWLQYPIWDI